MGSVVVVHLYSTLGENHLFSKWSNSKDPANSENIQQVEHIQIKVKTHCMEFCSDVPHTFLCQNYKTSYFLSPPD